MIEAAIFDFDGVIVDSEPAHKAFEQDVFGQLGLSISRKEHESYTGTTWKVMCRKIMKKHCPPISFEEFLKIFLDNKGRIYDRVALQDGIRETLGALSGEFRLAIASSAETDTIKRTLKRLGVSEFFGVVQGSESIANPKPDPEVFLKAAEALGASPGRCAVIEDAATGIMAARAAGMKSIGFASTGEQDLSGADVVVKRLSEIPPILSIL